MATLSLSRFEPTLGELEEPYAAHVLPSDLRTCRAVMVIAVAGFLGSVPVELLSSVPSSGARHDVTILLVAALLTAGTWGSMHRITSTPRYEHLVLAWTCMHALAVVILRARHAPVYIEATVVLDTLCCYIVVPNRLTFRIVPAMIMSVGALTVTAHTPEWHQIGPALFLTHAFIHAIGIWGSSRLYSERRAHFAASHLEAEMRRQLAHMANVDALTGTATRRHWLSLAEAEFLRVARYGGPLSVLMTDLDHFKRINDTYGHACGDAVLKHFGELLRRTCRGSDTIGRIGGEEFAVVLPGTDISAAEHVGTRLLAHCADSPARWESTVIPFSCSVGVAEALGSPMGLAETLAHADGALYAAKHAGRNTVRRAQAKQRTSGSAA